MRGTGLRAVTTYPTSFRAYEVWDYNFNRLCGLGLSCLVLSINLIHEEILTSGKLRGLGYGGEIGRKCYTTEKQTLRPMS